MLKTVHNKCTAMLNYMKLLIFVLLDIPNMTILFNLIAKSKNIVQSEPHIMDVIY